MISDTSVSIGTGLPTAPALVLALQTNERGAVGDPLLEEIGVFCFKPHERHVVDARVAPPQVVPGFDIGEERRFRLRFALEAAPRKQFVLKAGEETLRHRVVVCVARNFH